MPAKLTVEREELPKDITEGKEELVESTAEKEEAVEEDTETALEEQFSEEPLDKLKVIEAGLFLANRALNCADLAMLAHCTVKDAVKLVEELKQKYDSLDGSIEVVITGSGEASMQVKPKYLKPVSKLSKDVELSRKATRMLGLIGKKGELLQSELKDYFRGEIYAYVTELKELGYITSQKHGNTRTLKPTEKFHKTFQMSE